MEKCQKHNLFKTAYDIEKKVDMCNKCLFEQQSAAKSHSNSGLESGKSNLGKAQKMQQFGMFTALITRDLKNKFDTQYVNYKKNT